MRNAIITHNRNDTTHTATIHATQRNDDQRTGHHPTPNYEGLAAMHASATDGARFSITVDFDPGYATDAAHLFADLADLIQQALTLIPKH